MHTIDGVLFQKMILGAAASIENHKQQINELNVFPVPDGDTGTNMSMTICAAAAELRKAEIPSLTKAADTTASVMLRSARGNSGVILSLLFRGFAKALKGLDACDGQQLATALKSGVEAAYKAVMKPTEGTILTVARVSASDALRAAAKDPCFESVMAVTVASAEKALAATVNQNPVLQKAGVVDAGGKGWLYVLDSMLRVARGEEIDLTASSDSSTEVKDQADFSDFDTENITFSYCTEFIIARENTKEPENLRAFLSGLGDSLVLVDDDEIIKVHVHTNDPGIALQEALKYGSLATVKIENMKLQHSEKVMSQEEVAQASIAPAEKKYGMVAVCAGAGIAGVFRELGADNIIEGGQTMNPSTQDILERINATPSEVVFVFPNNKNIIMAAEQTIPLTEKKVIVIPSKTIPQGVSAMLLFDPDADEQTNIETMTEAMQNVQTLQITYAARNSDFDGHDIHEGEYLALFGSSLFGNDKDITVLLRGLAQRLQDEGSEFITVYYGADITEAQAEEAIAIFSEICPDAEINLINGGQPVYYYLISAE